MMGAKSNRMTMAQLLEANAEQVAKLPAEQLCLLQDELAEEAQRVKLASIRLLQSLNIKYGQKADAVRLAERQPTGRVRLPDGEFDVCCDTAKAVEWDQDRLIAAFDEMPPQDARHYCKASFSVEERKFTTAPPEIAKLLAPARTVKPGTQKFTLVKRGEG